VGYDEPPEEDRSPEDRPPGDAEEWSDEEWIEWLDSTDGMAVEPVNPVPRKPKTVAGQFLGAAMLGLHEIFYGRREDKQAQVAVAPGPGDDEDFEINLDPDDPSKSEVRFRED